MILSNVVVLVARFFVGERAVISGHFSDNGDEHFPERRMNVEEELVIDVPRKKD